MSIGISVAINQSFFMGNYNYLIEHYVLTEIPISANSIEDAIEKIRHKMAWKMAYAKELYIEIYKGKRTELSFKDLYNKDIYIKIHPLYEKKRFK